MKRCPKCNRTYTTNTQKFCTHDGGILVAVDTPQVETILIDPAELDAPTKAISRELVPDAEKFDPYKTTIGQPPPSQAKTEPRARITQDLTPVEPPPPETSAPDSGTLAKLPPLPQPTSPPTQSPAQSGSGPIAPSAPLPPPSTPSPQFPGAAQAQQVRPLAAAGPKKKSKVFLILGVLAVLLVLGVGVLGAGYIFWLRPLLARRVVVPTDTPRPLAPTEPTPRVDATPTNTDSPSATPQSEPPPYSAPADAVQFVNSNDKLDGKLAEHYVDFSFYYPERWQKDPKSGGPGATNFAKVERRLPPDFTQENFAVGSYVSAGSPEGDRSAFHGLVENLSAQFEKNFPGYRKVSEGETKVGTYDGYEFRFEAFSRNSIKGDINIWGRAIFLPPVDGTRNGVMLLMLATSLAPELRSIDDVGAKGELPMILESFRFGKK